MNINLKDAIKDRECIANYNNVVQKIEEYKKIKEIVEPKQLEVIQKHQFKNLEDGEVIESSDEFYLTSDEDFEIYREEMRQFYDEVGFVLPSPDHCPLLIAENELRIARRKFGQSLEKYTGLNYDDLCGHIDELYKYNDLMVEVFESGKWW